MAKKPAGTPEEGPEDGASMFGDGPGAGGGPGAYQVLARKYRPTTFEDLAGQEGMVRTLRNAFATGRIAHAFMLTGVRGVGKTTTARLLARALNYRTDKVDRPTIELDPPGVHCAAIMAGQHPDVLELDAASNTKVEEMRSLLDGVRYAPVSARYKVYIIDEVHMLSTHSFNALLKTLEEPPPHVKFIFATTEIRKVPVTVLSRCQRFNLQRFSTETLAAHLAGICEKEGAKVAPDALALIARAAEGSARDALSILDQAIVQSPPRQEIAVSTVREMLGLADRSRVLDLMEKAVKGDHRAALEEATSLLEAGAEASVLIKDLMDVATELSRAQALKDAYTFAGPADWGGRTKAMAARLSPAQAARIWRLLLQGFEDCARAPDPPAAAQMVVLRLAAAAALPPPEDGSRAAPASHARTPAEAPKREPAEAAQGARRDERAPTAQSGAQSGNAALAHQPHAHEHEHEGPRMHTMRDILALVEARREIGLQWEIEQFVRPIEIDYGHLHFALDKGGPPDMAMKLKAFLERHSGVEWEVVQAGQGQAGAPSSGGMVETAAETRNRRIRERIESAKAHPRIAEALKAFPNSKIHSVDAPDAEEPEEEAPRGNVVHVDFARREQIPDGPDINEGGGPPPSFPIEAYIDVPDEEDDDE
jgi:DNA polymerase-3 subunit gamma/tau